MTPMINNTIQASLISFNIFMATKNLSLTGAAWIFSWILFMKLDAIAEVE